MPRGKCFYQGIHTGNTHRSQRHNTQIHTKIPAQPKAHWTLRYLWPAEVGMRSSGYWTKEPLFYAYKKLTAVWSTTQPVASEVKTCSSSYSLLRWHLDMSQKSMIGIAFAPEKNISLDRWNDFLTCGWSNLSIYMGEFEMQSYGCTVWQK